jgi:hypothetical protein
MAQTRLKNACGEHALWMRQQELHGQLTLTNEAPRAAAPGNGLVAGSAPASGTDFDTESRLRGLGSSPFLGCSQRQPSLRDTYRPAVDIRPRTTVPLPHLSNAPRYL